jgi:hypothetical protein
MQVSMKLFPKWAEALGLHDAVIEGIDMKIHDELSLIQQFLRGDESRGFELD